MSRRRNPRKRPAGPEWPRDVPPYGPLRGWLTRGEDRTQDFQGWKVHAEKPADDALPVTIVSGHRRLP